MMIMKKEKSEIIESIAKMLIINKKDTAKEIITNEYPHEIVEIKNVRIQ